MHFDRWQWPWHWGSSDGCSMLTKLHFCFLSPSNSKHQNPSFMISFFILCSKGSPGQIRPCVDVFATPLISSFPGWQLCSYITFILCQLWHPGDLRTSVNWITDSNCLRLQSVLAWLFLHRNLYFYPAVAGSAGLITAGAVKSYIGSHF